MRLSFSTIYIEDLELGKAMKKVSGRVPHGSLVVYLPSHLVVSQGWLDRLIELSTHLDDCGVQNYLIAGDTLTSDPSTDGISQIQASSEVFIGLTLSAHRFQSRVHEHLFFSASPHRFSFHFDPS